MPQIDTQQITLSTARAKILSYDQSRTEVYITNEDSAIIIRIGDATVDKTGGTAAAIGLAILPLQTVPLISGGAGTDAIAACELYAIADSGTPKISVLEYGDFS